MKRVIYFPLLAVAMATVALSCNKTSFKKTPSGMLYKIIASDSKDSVVKEGQWLKLHYVQKINDSVLQTSYGKLPVYQKIATNPANVYNPAEIFNLLKKGDSAITVILVDSLLSKNLVQADQLPPFMKKGDKLTLTLRVLNVFTSDSAYQADYAVEAEKDAPRQQKEQAEQMAKMREQMKIQQDKDDLEMEKSGEAAKGVKAMEEYLAAKKITAQKTGKGTFVQIKEPGTGAQAAIGKYIQVKYAGRTLKDDKQFEANVYPLQLGVDPVIAGWVEGLQLFKEGGKGTLFIPGFRAYGANPNPQSGFAPFEPLIFDVEIMKVSDTPLQPAQPQQ